MAAKIEEGVAEVAEVVVETLGEVVAAEVEEADSKQMLGFEEFKSCVTDGIDVQKFGLASAC